MKLTDINIRDPFVLVQDGTYYLYGTRAKDFGTKTGGFDVYTSNDLINFSEPIQCFNSREHGLNGAVNWAPEVHRYKDSYYMFATFTKENGLRGVYVLKAQSPLGPFTPHSKGAVTPEKWECLDGTLYIDKKGEPYLVFCHEHTQIIDGTVCYIKLSDDLTQSVGEPVYMFSGSSPYWADKKPRGEHYITDGPFMYRTAEGELLLIWSTFVEHQVIARHFLFLSLLFPLFASHHLNFRQGDKLMLTYHTPNQTGLERPVFKELEDIGDNIRIK